MNRKLIFCFTGLTAFEFFQRQSNLSDEAATLIMEAQNDFRATDGYAIFNNPEALRYLSIPGYTLDGDDPDALHHIFEVHDVDGICKVEHDDVECDVDLIEVDFHPDIEYDITCDSVDGLIDCIVEMATEKCKSDPEWQSEIDKMLFCVDDSVEPESAYKAAVDFRLNLGNDLFVGIH